MSAKLLIADHRPIIQHGLVGAIGRKHIEIVGQPFDRASTLKLAKAKKPDVILLGDLADGDPMRSLRLIKTRVGDTPVVVCLTDSNRTYFIRSYALGAAGFVTLDDGAEAILNTALAAARNQSSWDRAEIDSFLSTPSEPVDSPIHITPRERQVIRLLSYGLPNREIGLLLKISIETVKEHVASIRFKLSVDDRTQAAVWAIQHGLD